MVGRVYNNRSESLRHCTQDLRPGFFLPVRVLSRLYRRLSLERPAAFGRHLNALRKVEWVVYARRPFGGPEPVLEALAHLTESSGIERSRWCGN
jgi:hypothetical protein